MLIQILRKRLKYDWVPPYGKGKCSDFIFLITNQYTSGNRFRSKLKISFTNKYNGIQEVENKYMYSIYKLPRYAPSSGYLNSIVLERSNYDLGYNSNKNYIFRVRSVEKSGILLHAMYGKIYGDILFSPGERKTASISLDYYLNPDYTNNLEFDPGRNLGTGANSFELLT